MPSVELLFGPMLIGTFLNMILYGILIVQMYHYYQTYKQDAQWIRYFILYLFIVETINTGCDMAMMFQPLIQKFGQAEALKFFPTMFSAEPIVFVCISTPIQLFFAWRIKVLTKSNILALVIAFFSLASFGGGVWTSVLLIHLKLFALKPRLHIPALVWFLTAVVADVLITGALVSTLSKRKTGFSGTDDAIQKIIRMTVQTGMLTAFFAIADVIFFLTLPHTALNFVWDISLGMTSNVTTAQRFLSSGIHRQHEDTFLEVNGPSHVIYELDAQKTMRSDMDYGITVTKVVETQQDPIIANRIPYQ